MSANKKSVKVSNKGSSTKQVSKKSVTPDYTLDEFIPDDFTPEQRLQMIAEAAYYIAESQAFQGNDPQADWLIAEIEINKMW